MNLAAFLQLTVATALFIAAASAAKSWAVTPTILTMALSLSLYAAGNLLMLRLIRQLGMATAFSLSSVLQLVAINIVAIAWFGEAVGMLQGIGICLAVVAIGLITLGPRLSH